ncbi:MAG: PilW family protein [Luteimonas sp.]
MKRSQQGFSLIELMIALVAGLIVIGAVLAFTVATVRAYSENIRSTRLTQDLRSGMNVVQRELRRAGFDAVATTRVLTDTNPSEFTELTVDGECVIYRYDRLLGGAGGAPQGAEIRGIRRNATTGSLQINADGSTVTCSGTAGWQDVSDPAVVNLTEFEPALRQCSFCARLSSGVDGAGVPVYDIATGSARNLSLSLTGALRNDATVSRQVTDSVRIRAENVSFVKNSPADCPAVQACTMP